MPPNLSREQLHMIETFQRHMEAELTGDMETTMSTMSDNPHLNHVPVMMGGMGKEGVRSFYTNHLVGKFFPPDMVMTPVSRTIGETQIVDEIFAKFTHSMAMDWFLPGLPATGKPIEIAFAVIVGFKDGKITHEHIYWDQASVLVQIGLLDPRGLPVSGVESARKVLDPNIPSRKI